MHWRNTHIHYGSLSIALHWFMLLLIVAVYASMELREFFPKGSNLREAFKTWHYMLGLSVFALVWQRFASRMTGAEPAIRPAPPHWQLMAAKAMHWALYALMMLMPIVGWMILSAEGKAIPFFGLQLPELIGADKSLAETLKEFHEIVGIAGYLLIGLHAFAALFHHLWLGDNTLRRLLPTRH